MSPTGQSQIWCLGGSGNPTINLKRWEVDMEILRGLENLGAPWDSMGRFPVFPDNTGSSPELLRPLVQA
jgi:hypothetical protein